MQYKFEKPIHGINGEEKYQCTIEWRNGKFISDEPATAGGKDTGPDPHTLLLSSLASCGLITMLMYIDRKGWNIPKIAVNVNMYQEIRNEKTVTIIDRDIAFISAVDEEQKKRLHEIVKRCPISKILQNDIEVRNFLLRDAEIEKKINYANDEITVVWKKEFCQHSGRCWSQLPEVFDYRIKKWVNPNGASSEKIIEQVKKCPSGALTYFYNNKK
jgi:putative redox protein